MKFIRDLKQGYYRLHFADTPLIVYLILNILTLCFFIAAFVHFNTSLENQHLAFYALFFAVQGLFLGLFFTRFEKIDKEIKRFASMCGSVLFELSQGNGSLVAFLGRYPDDIKAAPPKVFSVASRIFLHDPISTRYASEQFMTILHVLVGQIDFMYTQRFLKNEIFLDMANSPQIVNGYELLRKQILIIQKYLQVYINIFGTKTGPKFGDPINDFKEASTKDFKQLEEDLQIESKKGEKVVEDNKVVNNERRKYSKALRNT